MGGKKVVSYTEFSYFSDENDIQWSHFLVIHWIGEQCSETEENLKKINSKRAHQLVKDIDHCETSESYYCHRSFRNMPHRRTRDTEPIDRMLLLLPDKAVLANLLESAQLQFKQHGYAGRH